MGNPWFLSIKHRDFGVLFVCLMKLEDIGMIVGMIVGQHCRILTTFTHSEDV